MCAFKTYNVREGKDRGIAHMFITIHIFEAKLENFSEVRAHKIITFCKAK